MGADKIPTLESLERPENFQDVLRRDREDCLGCKIVGKSPLYMTNFVGDR